MVSTVNCKDLERPSVARRNKQILDAAEACFRQNGFHSTSMIQLSAAANMSVGHIYRYFSSKHEIISAIVQRDVAIAMADFNLFGSEEGKVIPAFLKAWRSKLEQMCDPDRSALWLEILAETGRNQEAARLVRNARAIVGRRLEAIIAAGSAGRWTDTEIAAKAKLLLGLTDSIAFGIVTRSAATPTQLVDEVLSCGERLLS
jgi:AcrR family transcriptional regulator